MDDMKDTGTSKQAVQYRVKTRDPADPNTVEICALRKTMGDTIYYLDKGAIQWMPTQDGREVDPLFVLNKAEATELMRSLWNRGIRIAETQEVNEVKPDPRQPGPRPEQMDAVELFQGIAEGLRIQCDLITHDIVRCDDKRTARALMASLAVCRTFGAAIDHACPKKEAKGK